MLKNTTSPWARNWVPEATEFCQRDCGIARMWGTLFWSCQCIFSVGYLYVYYHPDKKTPFVQLGAAQKMMVAVFLIKAYAGK
jgi:hypothetical protein